MREDESEHRMGRHKRGSRIARFAQPWLLLQLAKQPAHGYELMEGLAQQDSQPALDPGTLYRILRFFEEEGVVSSEWETGGAGPARRVYKVTDQGLDYLHVWAAAVRRDRDRLDRFLADYESYLSTHPDIGTKQGA